MNKKTSVDGAKCVEVGQKTIFYENKSNWIELSKQFWCSYSNCLTFKASDLYKHLEKGTMKEGLVCLKIMPISTLPSWHMATNI